MATPLVYQKYPNYHFLALKQWFANILVLNLIYTLKKIMEDYKELLFV